MTLAKGQYNGWNVGRLYGATQHLIVLSVQKQIRNQDQSQGPANINSIAWGLFGCAKDRQPTDMRRVRAKSAQQAKSRCDDVTDGKGITAAGAPARAMKRATWQKRRTEKGGLSGRPGKREAPQSDNTVKSDLLRTPALPRVVSVESTEKAFAFCRLTTIVAVRRKSKGESERQAYVPGRIVLSLGDSIDDQRQEGEKRQGIRGSG